VPPSPPPSPPVPPAPPSPPAPAPPACKVGDLVKCPGSDVARCAGGQCCPDLSICPSASKSFSGCPKPKDFDCTSKPSPSPPAPPVPPSPPAPPAPPSPPRKCKVGALVQCPGSVAKCAGNQCCPDLSICPSAGSSFKACQKPKEQDCTKAFTSNLAQELLI
jgi:hypothetical protein